jgi:glycosyltransferase involved in cell wall biosynthesis
MHSVHPTPKFSIITVTYNAEKVLEDTIQSVISQTYHHIEYIIVDGASKDGTLSIINRYRSRIHTVVSEPDKGLYDAMNKGIALASGDYLCFLNAGDCFHEDDTLQQMVHTINGNELPDILYGETAIVDKHRLSGGGNDYPESESIPQRKISDHGKALRADWNRGASCMVRDPCSYSPVGEGI